MSYSIRSLTPGARWVVAGALVMAGAAWAGSQPPSLQRLQLLQQWLQHQAELQASLHLNTSQTAAWQALQAEQRALFMQGRSQLSEAADLARSELSAPDADLAGLAATLETEVDLWMADQRALRARKLAFYETLSAEQQAVLREELIRRMERAESLRDTLLQLATTAP
ncbi:MAG: Spy/CpxP family protein refolding chaperone [Lysobacteraceae bacterium]